MLAIEPQVFDLLVYLIQNRERVVSKDELLASIWGGRIVSESTLSTRITAARSAIGDSGDEQRLIKTLSRKGVRFIGAVREQHGRPQDRMAELYPAMARNRESPGGERAIEPAGVGSEPGTPVIFLPDRPSIAVLPFTNISGDPEQEYFADGVVEDIITALSRFPSLFVIARNSSFTYKGQAVDIKRVGRELGVRYVLEGSVRRAGNRVRITGQLIRPSPGCMSGPSDTMAILATSLHFKMR